MATRSYCTAHKRRTLHKRGRCTECYPDTPVVEALLAEPLTLELVTEYVIREPPKALDVIRAAGEAGATVREVIDAGADATEMVELERRGLIEQRVNGWLRQRDGRSLYFATTRAARAA